MNIAIDAILLLSAGAACGCLLLLSALGGEAPRSGKPVLVISPPWRAGASAVVLAGGGTLVGPVSAPFATFAVFDAPDFEQKTRRAGAWFLRDAGALSAFCTTDGIS